jgi:hypothetical protein
MGIILISFTDPFLVVGRKFIHDKKMGFLRILFSYLLCNAVLYFMPLLFPDDLGEYTNYEEYFYSRKNWFFGFLALSFVADTIDTYMKGANYVSHLTWEYPVRNISHIALCLVAMKINNKKFHLGLVLAFLIYELSFILRLYYQ